MTEILMKKEGTFVFNFTNDVISLYTIQKTMYPWFMLWRPIDKIDLYVIDCITWFLRFFKLAHFLLLHGVY